MSDAFIKAKSDLAAKLAAARALTENDSVKAHRDAGNAVEAAQEALSDAIAEGAQPCPICVGRANAALAKAKENLPRSIEEMLTTNRTLAAAADGAEVAKGIIMKHAQAAYDAAMAGAKPHGMEHTLAKGRSEFAIGCRQCKPHEHTDGTIRRPHVRGGLLPKHAVEAWNVGPDAWQVDGAGAGVATALALEATAAKAVKPS